MKKIFYFVLILLSFSSVAFGQTNKLQLSFGYSHAIVNNFTGDTYKETVNSFGSGSSDVIGQSMQDQLNGFDLSGLYKLNDHFAAKAGFGWYAGSSASGLIPGGNYVRGSVQNPTFVLVIPGATNSSKQSYYSLMAGVEYKDFKSAHKLNPFGQLLIGVSFENTSYNIPTGYTHAIIYQTQNLKVNVTAFSIDAGAGLDLKLNKNFDLRLIQIDFVPTLPGTKLIQKTGDLRGPFPGTPFPNEQLYVGQDISTVNKFQANLRFGAGIVFTPNL